MTDWKEQYRNCEKRLKEITIQKAELERKVEELKKNIVDCKNLSATIANFKNNIRDLEKRIKNSEEFTTQILSQFNKYVPNKFQLKLTCPYCGKPKAFQKDHSVYHTACQKRAKDARYKARLKSTETFQQDAIDTILLMLELLEGEALDTELVYYSMIEISKILKNPYVEPKLPKLEKELLEAIKTYEKRAKEREAKKLRKTKTRINRASK